MRSRITDSRDSRKKTTFFSDAAHKLLCLQEALVAFGFQADTVSIETLGKPEAVLAIGVEPVRIDLINRIAGVTFDEARASVVRGRYGDVEVTFIGKEALLRNKRATGRQRDLGDVEELFRKKIGAGHRWNHVIDKVRGGLRHVATVAGGADASSLARERDHKPRAAARADRTAEAEAEDAALKVAAEFLLDVAGHGQLLAEFMLVKADRP